MRRRHRLLLACGLALVAGLGWVAINPTRPVTPTPSVFVSLVPSAGGGSAGPVGPSGPSMSAIPAASGAACAPTDQLNFIYHPARLIVLAACIRVTGLVAVIRQEADGDYHMLLALDPPYAYLLTPANFSGQHGDLVIEPVCVTTVTQADAIAVCTADKTPLTVLPQVGQRVWMEGRYVTDSAHGGWAELHPLYRWQAILP